MIDYHIHTPLCRHATGTLEQYRDAALKKGLVQCGIADHFPLAMLGFAAEPAVTMEPDELAGYVKSVQALRDTTAGLTVRLGIEVDYLPGSETKLAPLLDRYPFDYRIGSIHFMDGWDFTHPYYAERFAGINLEEAYRRYYELVWEACRSGLFDIIGHIDVIKKFGYRPVIDQEPLWRRTAAVLKETDTCLELNTAGMDAPVGECYPCRGLLGACWREGVPVTLGSDAHDPDQVGRYFDSARALLQETGYRELALFAGRKRSTLALKG